MTGGPETFPGSAPGRRFWQLMATALVLGVVGAVAGLVFLGVTGLGADWYGNPGSGWFEGEWWWIAVAAAAGLVVGILRKAMAMPDEIPGLIQDLQSEHVDATMVPKIVAVSAVSLVGGASLGPEVALGQMGGGTAQLIASRRGFDEDTTKESVLSGMAGAFGGLFSSPVLGTALTLEVARPPTRRVGSSFFGAVIASSTSLGIYFAIAGSVFLGLYDVPSYAYEDWQLFAGAGLGILAAAVVVGSLAITTAVKRLVAAVKLPPLLLPVFGGVLFGLAGVALPLTNFTGSDQLTTVVTDGSSLGAGLLIATLLAKMFTFAVSSATGFIGGPIFPMLFIGGTSGVIVHLLVPGIPLALAFSCMLAAVPGSVVAAPFSLVLLTAVLTQVGALQTSPILIAVTTAFLTMSAIKVLVARRKATAPNTT